MISALRAAQERARLFSHIDWFLFASALAISLLGLVTMRSFSVENSFFDKQMIWICISIACFFAASIPEYHFLRRTPVITSLFIITTVSLALIFLFGAFVKGAQNRFNLGFLSVQPSDPAKLLLVLMLAKYFARRHVEIAAVKHILVSGAYALALFILIFFQPDFGSAIIIGSIWLGMVLAAGISWKHLAALFIAAIVVTTGLWQYGLQPYQKQRILTFIHPLTDIQGTGYNAYQSTIAVGSGEWLGKGIGYGTQSKLRFLPEYQTDFIFAAFAEEWGFIGVVILFGLFAVLILRTLAIAGHGADNFDMLFGIGIAAYFMAQFTVHVGMNMGLLPITGTTLPLMSYGGSHLVTEYVALGILMGMRRHARSSIQARDETEIVGTL
ncbi:rod shape-determining protein RodA [Candidatus Kaiserbacteria bacterium RIFCSPHIGHO2_01_FULL_54_36]|uniref:Rod shape-determining protein RodA n=1 Tax=Candidatus Kaiserbacteria bacterium RIFCSPHIGHO2_01_FULL_54_36 TaxID=1798482 RepID=A0A1F6CKN1_9BACT|nr:MAG: rod shape-determining protein RodA [Candidatus Kaiserbacteria bacterium RIFCSPHIGHO2_01_FULL_54_36]OGG75297.1 MAG: rod shape-determining protein RodA [Candidatus Kaiserbacteria bacterium RIFCSPLOWO2_01_FULL_54_22]